MLLDPISLNAWVKAHRDELKPPVGNKLVWPSDDYIIMAVGGPNARDDYHVNQGEEIFYQVEGSIQLNVIHDGKRKTVRIKEGEMFVLPRGVPHSPQRPAGSLGVVVELVRDAAQEDIFQWYCHQCDAKMYQEAAHIDDIVQQLPEIFCHFYDNADHATCQHCGWIATRVAHEDNSL